MLSTKLQVVARQDHRPGLGHVLQPLDRRPPHGARDGREDRVHHLVQHAPIMPPGARRWGRVRPRGRAGQPACSASTRSRTAAPASASSARDRSTRSYAVAASCSSAISARTSATCAASGSPAARPRSRRPRARDVLAGAARRGGVDRHRLGVGQGRERRAQRRGDGPVTSPARCEQLAAEQVGERGHGRHGRSAGPRSATK